MRSRPGFVNEHSTVSRVIRTYLASGLALTCALTAGRAASADTYYYVEWSAADVAGGTATGTITLPDNSTVTVTFAAVSGDGGAGDLYGAQLDGQGTSYWQPPATWTSTQVSNAPPDADIIQLAGGEDETYTVTLSAPIVDPIMAIVSLGADGTPCTYDFNSPFTIVSQGTDGWGGSSTSLVQLPNDVLQGEEGSGTIQFQGTFSTFSWTVPTPEVWHGFTFGIRTTLALDPDAGGPDAGTGGDAEAEEDAGASLPDSGTGVAAHDSGVGACPTGDSSTLDTGGGVRGDAGCSCRAAGTSGDSWPLPLVGVALFGALHRLRRRSR